MGDLNSILRKKQGVPTIDPYVQVLHTDINTIVDTLKELTLGGVISKLTADSLRGVIKPSAGIYQTTDYGGGLWIFDASDTESTDNTGTMIVSSNGNRFKRLFNGAVEAEWFGAVGDGIVDCTAAMNLCFAAGRDVQLRQGYYRITSPLKTSSAPNINISGQGEKGTHLVWQPLLAFSDPDFSMIEINLESDSPMWGIKLAHLHLIGNNQKGSAVHAKNISYFLMEDVAIDGYIGSALWLDKVQDSTFTACNFQDSGATVTGGDPFLNTDTTHPAIWITSTIEGDTCNMVRFNACQIEQQKASPFVRIDSGIGIMFNQPHAEVRDASQFGNLDFIEAADADINITDAACSNFRLALNRTGYGTTTIMGGRSFGAIDCTLASGKTGQFRIANAIIGDLTIVAWGLANDLTLLAVNSVFGDVVMSYPSGKHEFFGCSLGSIMVDQSGGGALGVHLYGGVVMGTTSFTSTAPVGSSIQETDLTGNVIFSCQNGKFSPKNYSGTLTIDANLMRDYFPKAYAQSFGVSIPAYGIWNPASTVWNTALTAGAILGWKKMNDGWDGIVGTSFAAKTYTRYVTAPSASTDAGELGFVALDNTYFYWYSGTRWNRIGRDTSF